MLPNQGLTKSMTEVRMRINQAKRRLRPNYKFWDWQICQYYTTMSYMRFCQENVQRINEAEVSCDAFVERFEQVRQPVVILGATANWPAHRNWTISRLMELHGSAVFRCGDSPLGGIVRIKMRDFLLYVSYTRDDSPLAICDSSFAEHHLRQLLLMDFTVPKYFRQDLMKYARQSQRPPYRWFMVGPAGAGVRLSMENLSLGRWSALVHGQRRWCLFPNHTPKQQLMVPRTEFSKFSSEASTWFRQVYPKVNTDSWPAEYRPLEILQAAGDVVYVPPGWWYVVLNLEFCCGVEQSFCSRSNFPLVYPKVEANKPSFAKNWLHKLRVKWPEVNKTLNLTFDASSVEFSTPSLIDDGMSSINHSLPIPSSLDTEKMKSAHILVDDEAGMGEVRDRNSTTESSEESTDDDPYMLILSVLDDDSNDTEATADMDESSGTDNVLKEQGNEIMDNCTVCEAYNNLENNQ